MNYVLYGRGSKFLRFLHLNMNVSVNAGNTIAIQKRKNTEKILNSTVNMAFSCYLFACVLNL